mmetsp:Transcript_12333/g.30031  ORF Transcript_12333/g.30031 Transcript_12333/m.30031 type:complete len:218 (-) Transcript_12333:654-1307(-)
MCSAPPSSSDADSELSELVLVVRLIFSTACSWRRSMSDDFDLDSLWYMGRSVSRLLTCRSQVLSLTRLCIEAGRRLILLRARQRVTRLLSRPMFFGISAMQFCDMFRCVMAVRVTMPGGIIAILFSLTSRAVRDERWRISVGTKMRSMCVRSIVRALSARVKRSRYPPMKWTPLRSMCLGSLRMVTVVSEVSNTTVESGGSFSNRRASSWFSFVPRN